MAKNFPKELYVKRETDHDTEYFIPSEDRAELVSTGERIPVGVYVLKETITLEGIVVARG